MNLCAGDREEREHGVGAGVIATILLETLQFVGLPEVVGRVFRLRKNPMNLFVSDRKVRERRFGYEKTCVPVITSNVRMGWVLV
jgi:hypothetical protein